MSRSLLLNLVTINPGEIIARYSQWIYFGLVMVFFISVTGIALRRHFGRPYVKPMIVGVGLLLTVTVFQNRQALTVIASGWSTLGSILLIAMLAIIPFGLAKGFGLSARRSFWISYLLGYAIAWAQYPQFFQAMNRKGLYLINLILLVLFLFSIWQSLRFRIGNRGGKEYNLSSEDEVASDRLSLDSGEAERDFKINQNEDRLIKKQMLPASRAEYQSLEQIEKALGEIEDVIRRDGQNLTNNDLQTITVQLKRAIGNERIMKRDLIKVKYLVAQISKVSIREFTRLKSRAQRANGTQRELLLKELSRQTEKLSLESAIDKMDSDLSRATLIFDQRLKSVIQGLRVNSNPGISLSNLTQAKNALTGIQKMLLAIKRIEKRLVQVIHEEVKIIKVEDKLAA